MAFNTLLLLCLSEKTSFSENKAKLSVNRKPDELVLFFDMKDGDISAKIRKDWGMPSQGSKLCDGLIFYKTNPTDLPTLCLVELKGNDIKHAAEQIKESCEALKKTLQASLKETSCKDFLKKFKFKAYICTLSSINAKDKAEVDNILKTAFDKGQYTIGGNSNFEEFLRK